MMHGGEIFFNIIDGKPTLLYNNHVCKSVQAKKLSGEKGYDHLFS